MTRQIAEWIWRLAVLAALAWIGLELRAIHDDMTQPADDQTTTSAERDRDVDDSLEGMRDDIAVLDQKVDALLIAVARLKE